MKRPQALTLVTCVWFLGSINVSAQEARSYLRAAIDNARAMQRFDVLCKSETTHEYSEDHFDQVVQQWRHVSDTTVDHHLTVFKQQVQQVAPAQETKRNLILRAMVISDDLTADFDLKTGFRNREGASSDYMLMLSDVLDVRLLGLTDRVYSHGAGQEDFEEWTTTLLARPHINIEKQVGTDVFVVVLNDNEDPWYRFRINLETLTIERASTVHADGSVFRSIDLDWKEENGLYVPVECRMHWKSLKEFQGSWKRRESTQIVRFDWLKCNEPIDLGLFDLETLNDPKELEQLLAPPSS